MAGSEFERLIVTAGTMHTVVGLIQKFDVVQDSTSSSYFNLISSNCNGLCSSSFIFTGHKTA